MNHLLVVICWLNWRELQSSDTILESQKVILKNFLFSLNSDKRRVFILYTNPTGYSFFVTHSFTRASYHCLYIALYSLLTYICFTSTGSLRIKQWECGHNSYFNEQIGPANDNLRPCLSIESSRKYRLYLSYIVSVFMAIAIRDIIQLLMALLPIEKSRQLPCILRFQSKSFEQFLLRSGYG